MLFTETTAEFSYLMLAIARRIVEAEKYVEADAWQGSSIYCQVEIFLQFNYWNIWYGRYW